MREKRDGRKFWQSFCAIGKRRSMLMEIHQSFCTMCRVARKEIWNFSRSFAHVAHSWKKREENLSMLPRTSGIVSEERKIFAKAFPLRKACTSVLSKGLLRGNLPMWVPGGLLCVLGTSTYSCGREECMRKEVPIFMQGRGSLHFTCTTCMARAPLAWPLNSHKLPLK